MQTNLGLIRLDRDVIRRIREILSDEGGIKMTRLAIRANVQYNRLLKYISWLEGIGAIQVISDGKSRAILITEKGREILANF